MHRAGEVLERPQFPLSGRVDRVVEAVSISSVAPGFILARGTLAGGASFRSSCHPEGRRVVQISAAPSAQGDCLGERFGGSRGCPQHHRLALHLFFLPTVSQFQRLAFATCSSAYLEKYRTTLVTLGEGDGRNQKERVCLLGFKSRASHLNGGGMRSPGSVWLGYGVAVTLTPAFLLAHLWVFE